MIRALVVDDHPLLRLGIKHMLAQEPDFAAPGEAVDAEDALRRIKERTWDVVLLDISMPGRSGLDVLREIRGLRPTLPVLVLSLHSEEKFAVRALRAGAHGYLTKNDAPTELVQAIRRVLTGKKYVSPSIAETLANAVESGSSKAPHERLSDRELQVMCQIAWGKTVSEVAQEATLSVKTISTYRSRALKKMKMRTNAEFTRYAIENHVVS